MQQMTNARTGVASLVLSISLCITGCGGSTTPPDNQNAGQSGAAVDPGPVPEGLSEPEPEEPVGEPIDLPSPDAGN